MAYAVMMSWKHKNPIDWKEMASEDFSKMPKGTTVQWFAIDEYNHGSFVTYTKVKKFTMALKLNWMQKGKMTLLKKRLK